MNPKSDKVHHLVTFKDSNYWDTDTGLNDETQETVIMDFLEKKRTEVSIKK